MRASGRNPKGHACLWAEVLRSPCWHIEFSCYVCENGTDVTNLPCPMAIFVGTFGRMTVECAPLGSMSMGGSEADILVFLARALVSIV
jgi:hypothetical protein